MTAIEPTASPVDDDPRLRLIVELLQDKKAHDVVVIDLRPVTDTADFFVICSGTSDPHLRSMAEDLVDGLRQQGHRPWHVEGRQSQRWVLVDLVDIVIHIFAQEAREFYALERLWGDAEVTRFEDRWEEELDGGWPVLKGMFDDR